MDEAINGKDTDPVFIDWGRAHKDITYAMIMDEFKGLSLEEKVDKLVEAYARLRAYGG